MSNDLVRVIICSHTAYEKVNNGNRTKWRMLLKRRMRNRESGIGNRESGIGNRESGMGNEK